MPQNTIEFPNLDISLTVPRVAFEFMGTGVYWYGIIICTAIVLGILYAIKSAPKVGLLPDTMFDAAFVGVLCGVFGARAYYVAFSETPYTVQEAIFGLRDGGLAFYGGVIGAFVGSAVFMKLRGVRFAPVTDLMGVGFLLGLSIGRWGNFFNQEAFGAPTATNLPWGMTGDNIITAPEVKNLIMAGGTPDAVLVHPCFLYESLWCLLGFALLHFYMRKWQTFDGEILLLFIVWYGAGRAFIESLRLDALMAGDIRVSQLVAIVSAATAMLLFCYFKSSKNAKHAYVRFKDLEDSKALVANHAHKVKLEREKEKALSRLRKTQRELNDPFAESVAESKPIKSDNTAKPEKAEKAEKSEESQESQDSDTSDVSDESDDVHEQDESDSTEESDSCDDSAPKEDKE
ncbi:MAG: prolipoprotein diacylglyceryl transferase [Oscillospiraceae bacterium]|nr:prolipoprotein diacylglyceryl transferase [Oscillospiraceae bacterium]